MSAPRSIYLLRHGQTEFNAVRRMQGRCDSGLTETGIAQARAMGAALQNRLGDAAAWAVRVSPLGRAQQTARLVCDELGLPHAAIVLDDRLLEVDFGAWEKVQVDRLYAHQPQLDGMPFWQFAAPGGEAYEAVVARINAWLADPALPENVIVVAHGLLGKIWRGVYGGLTKAQTWALDMPQDAFFHLQHGVVTRIEC